MKNIFIVLALCAMSFSSAYSLDPVKVAIVNTGNAAVTVRVDLNNYASGSAVTIFEGMDQLITPNGSGIVVAIAQGATDVGGTTDWGNIAPSTVNSNYVLDVYVAGTLFAQYRLDNLILSQSQGGVADTDGNIIPNENDASTLGTDTQRWKDVFVGPASFHIGAPGDEASISYTTGTNTLNLTSDITSFSADIAVTGNASIVGNTTVDGNATIGNSNQNDAHVINGKVSLENNSNNVSNPALYLSNRNNDNTSIALIIDEGHQALSVDNGTTTIDNNDPITVGNKTIIRLKSQSGNSINGNTLSDGTVKGQVIYITNENSGDIGLAGNILGNATITQRSAAQFIWNSSDWIMLNR